MSLAAFPEGRGLALVYPLLQPERAEVFAWQSWQGSLLAIFAAGCTCAAEAASIVPRWPFGSILRKCTDRVLNFCVHERGL